MIRIPCVVWLFTISLGLVGAVLGRWGGSESAGGSGLTCEGTHPPRASSLTKLFTGAGVAAHPQSKTSGVWKRTKIIMTLHFSATKSVAFCK